LNAYQINQQNIQVVEAIAYLNEDIGDQTKACEFFEILLSLEPKNKAALEKLARFRDQIGDDESAIEYMERLKEIDPNNQFVSMNLERAKERFENKGNIMYFFRNLFKK